MAGESLRSLVQAVAARLERAGVASPLADAIALVGHVAGIGTSEVRVRMARGDAVADGPGPDGPVLARTVPDGPVPDGPGPDGPVLARTVPDGPVPGGPVPGGPVPGGPVPGGPVPGGPVPGGPVPGGLDREALEAAVARRAAREPLQHILGSAAFRTVTLEVGPGVFVPRPETEVVAGRAIRAAAEVARRGDVPSCADLCAGSGAIGIAIAAEVPTARVSLVELDSAAFAYLARNVAAQDPDVRERLDATRADARTALVAFDGTLDVVVSNPPYIPPGATPRDAEVADHDPAVALFGLGPDGLEVPRGIVAAAARLLRPGGTFVMEHGDEQGAAVRAMLEAAMLEGTMPEGTPAWTGVETGTDHTGRDRFVVATRA